MTTSNRRNPGDRGHVDPLTGLLSRSGFLELVERKCAEPRQASGDIALIVMDIQNLHHLNEACGTDAGDRALTECAARVRLVCRENDFGARVGDDQFALLLTGILGDEHALLAVHKLLKLSENPLPIPELHVVARIKIGLALASSAGCGRGELFRGAMRALYAAKASDDSYDVFRRGVARDDSYDAVLAGDFLRAVGGADTQLAFQGKMSVESGRLCGAEALMRWNHPSRGLIDPFKVIDLAKFTGRLNSLSSWILDHALKACASWHGRGLRVPVCVNLEAESFADPLLPEGIADALELWRVDAGSLVIELTETTLMARSGQVPANVERLGEMGVRIAIDDFGTGHSSLAYLSRLNVQELKIDKSFIDKIDESPRDHKLVETIVNLGHALGMTVTAEGVERWSQYDLLAGLRCDVVQGFLVSQPACVETFVDQALASSSIAIRRPVADSSP